MLTDYTAAAIIDEDGKLKLTTPIAFAGAMKQFTHGARVTVRVQTASRRRTSQANRYYWGVILAILSEDTGYEPDELHEYFKKRFNPMTV